MGSLGGTLALQRGSAPRARIGRNKGKATTYWLPLVLLGCRTQMPGRDRYTVPNLSPKLPPEPGGAEKVRLPQFSHGAEEMLSSWGSFHPLKLRVWFLSLTSSWSLSPITPDAGAPALGPGAPWVPPLSAKRDQRITLCRGNGHRLNILSPQAWGPGRLGAQCPALRTWRPEWRMYYSLLSVRLLPAGI